MPSNEMNPEPGRPGLKKRAAGLAQKARSTATDTLEHVKDSVAERADRVADRVEGVSSRTAAQEPGLAGHVSQFADGMHRLADRLRDRSITELVSDAQLLARRHPLMFILGGLALGVAAARFMKASSPEAGGEGDERAWRAEHERVSEFTTSTPGVRYSGAAAVDPAGMSAMSEPSSRNQEAE
jgi:hypothetical protein